MTDVQVNRLYELSGEVRHNVASAMNGIGEIQDICHTVRRLRAGAVVPPVISLLLVGAVSVLLIGANYPEKVMVKNTENPDTSVMAGQMAMLKGDWQTACGLFGDAASKGADPNKCLAWKAECEYYCGQIVNCLATCNLLDEQTNGSSPSAPYLRGLAFLKGDHKDAAIVQFQIADMRGHPCQTPTEGVEIMEVNCEWVWLGNRWDNVEDTCVPPDVCTAPKMPGQYIGQQVSVPCQSIA